MSEEWNVDVRELPPVRVALLEYKAEGLKGRYQESIGMLFLEVEGFLMSRGHKTDGLRRFGVPFSEGPKLVRYWCCIEAPEGLVADEGAVQVRELAGGRYAVLTLVKDAAVGDKIARFHSEYAPGHDLTPDETRPPIEIYHPRTVEYCAPVV